MHWDVPHQRAAGFTLQVLHYSSACQTMAYLAEHPGSHTIDVARDATPDEPNIASASHCLGVLRNTGLVKRADTASEAGTHSAYSLTRFGTEMVAALDPLVEWATARYGIEDHRDALQAAVFLFDRRWSFSLMAAVVNAGAAGIEPGRAEKVVNDMVAALPEGAAHRMHPQPRYAALHELRDNGLISKRQAPTLRSPARVLYMATATGESLMEAMWPVAEWGLSWDGQLSAFVGEATTWWGEREV